MQSIDQLLLKIGAPVGVPPSGHKTIYSDTDGSIQTIDSTGAKTPIGIGSTTSWLGAARSRASLLSATMDSEAFYDWIDNDGFATNLSGSATVISSTTDAGGVLNSSTGGAGSSTAYCFPKGTPCLFANMIAGGAPFFIQMRVKFGTVDANTVYYISPKPAATPAAGKAAAFGVIGSASTTVLAVQMFDGTTPTNTLTSVAIDTAAYHDLGIFSDGTNYSFFYDGVLVATAPSSQLGGTATPALWAFVCSTTTAAVRTILVDKTYAAFKGQ